MSVTAQVEFYPPLPTDTGNESPSPIVVSYKITEHEIQTDDGLPVTGSVTLAETFVRACRNGLIERIEQVIEEKRKTGMPKL